jgi:hypothetical protein
MVVVGIIEVGNMAEGESVMRVMIVMMCCGFFLPAKAKSQGGGHPARQAKISTNGNKFFIPKIFTEIEYHKGPYLY